MQAPQSYASSKEQYFTCNISKFTEDDNEPQDGASHLLIWQLLSDIPGNPMG